VGCFKNWVRMLVMKGRQKRLHIIGLALLIIMIGTGAGLSLETKSVAVQLEGQTITANTFKTTVGEVLNELGVSVGPGDIVKPGLDTVLNYNQSVQVFKVFPVAVLADGKQIEISTTATSVEEALRLAGVEVGPLDRVNPAGDTQIEGSTTIQVVRVAQKMIYQTESIPAAIERTADNTLERGIQRTVNQGSAGIGRQTIMVSYEDGKEVNREVIKSEIIKSPINKIVAAGVLTSVSRGGNRIDFQRAIEVRASAYSYSAGSITSTGQKVKVGGIAVDPKVIAYGTRVYVEGYGYATANDCGGAIKDNKIDIFFESDKECKKWGVKKVKLYVLE